MKTPPRRRFLGLLGSLAGAGLLAACASLRLQKPEVALADIRLLDASLLEQRFVLTLRVTNPNKVEIPIEGLNFDLALNGQHFAKGVSNQPTVIPGLGEGRVEVTATTGLAAFLRQFKALGKGHEKIAYRLQGRLVTGSFGGIDFDQQGELALPRGAGEGGSGPSRAPSEQF